MDLEGHKRLVEELMTMNNNLEEQNIALEMEVKASQKIIQKLKKDNKLLEQYEEAIIDRDDKIQKLKKCKGIADDVIKNLQEDRHLKVQEVLKEKEKLTTEKDFLEKEIDEIRIENCLKEKMLKTIEIEMTNLENKMIEFNEREVKTEEKYVQTDTFDTDTDTGMENEDLLECEICSERFQFAMELKNHKKSKHSNLLLQTKVNDLESQLSKEKHELSIKLALLKEKDKMKMGVCLCISYCRIFHT